MARCYVLSAEEKRAIAVRHDQGAPVIALAREYKVTRPAIRHVLRREGRSPQPARPRHTHNPAAFDSLSPEALYWLGFIFTDGCIDRQREGGWRLTVNLGPSDRGHLCKLRAFLQATNPVRERTSSGGCGFTLGSRRLTDRIRGYGMVPSRGLESRAIESLAVSRDFWRGAVDGDGWVYAMSEGRQPRIGFCGGLPLVEQFSAFVTGIAGACPPIYRQGAIHAIQITGDRARTLIRGLYAEAPVSLDRKQVAADLIMSRER